MKTSSLVPSVALFALAGAAFSNAQYALGVWLALGTAAVAAHGILSERFADRPATVNALHSIAKALSEAENAAVATRTETCAALADLTARVSQLQMFLSAATVATRGGPSGGVRSPVRPPNGVR